MNISKILMASACACMLMFASCKTPQNVAYFQNPETIVEIASQQQLIKLKPGDKLSIVVKSKDPVVSDLFNLPQYTQRVGTASASSNSTGSQVQTYHPVS